MYALLWRTCHENLKKMFFLSEQAFIYLSLVLFGTVLQVLNFDKNNFF